MNKYCIIIPCYRHAVFLEAVLSKLLKFNLPVIVVDDGNEVNDKKLIENTVKAFENVYLESYEENKGKGYAFIKGLYKALSLGFTHAIQIDADGQHDCEDIDRLTALSDMYPNCVISGAPVYDESAPFARRFFRKLTTFFTNVETLSGEIKDAMIGFRSYPVSSTLDAVKSCRISYRMNFDVEILVRLKWRGIHVKFFETKVIYPENGISNFKGFRDNVYLSLMHTKLCTLMILTFPYRLYINAKG